MTLSIEQKFVSTTAIIRSSSLAKVKGRKEGRKKERKKGRKKETKEERKEERKKERKQKQPQKHENEKEKTTKAGKYLRKIGHLHGGVI